MNRIPVISGKIPRFTVLNVLLASAVLVLALMQPALAHAPGSSHGVPDGLSPAEWQTVRMQLPGANEKQHSRQALVHAKALGQRQYLKAPDAQEDDLFGYAVALHGDTLVIGVPNESSGAPKSGAVIVFVRTNDSWTQQATLKADPAQTNAGFGFSVAIHADTMAVGAPAQENNTGAAYVFTRNGTQWSQTAQLMASNAQASDFFGASVGIDADTIVVGAQGEASGTGDEADNSANYSGAAYVFVRDGDFWIQEAYLKASNIESMDVFGHSVAIHDDTVVIGAPNESSSASGGPEDNSAMSSGAAYVFTRTNGSWQQEGMLKAANADIYDTFGAAVAIHGDTVVVGATGESSAGSDPDDNSATESGAAYVFVRDGNAWHQQALLKASNAQEYDGLGWAVAIHGDWVVAGAPFGSANASAPIAGTAYAFERNASLWNQQAILTAHNAETADSFGAAISLHEGTVVAGAPSEAGNGSHPDDNTAPKSGAAYVFVPNDYPGQLFIDGFEQR